MKTIPSSPVPCLTSCDRDSLVEYFKATWALDDWLMQSIQAKATFYTQPDPLRNPLIFYLGHTAVFFINKLVQVGLGSRINPAYEQLFEMGVDPDSPQELKEASEGIKWPEVEAVWAYRDQVFELVSTLLQSVELSSPIDVEHPLWALLMSLEHSRVHFETSSMLIRQVPPDQLQQPEGWHYADDVARSTDVWLEVPGGAVQWGKSWTDPIFGWDMEYGQRQVEVAPFLVGQQMVSNQAFLEFVAADGYHCPEYWSVEGWAWREHYQVHRPKFWIPSVSGYRYRAMFEERSLPLHWPVEVNFYEADAFCRWKGEGSRLMTEAEWSWLVQTFEPQDPACTTDRLDTAGYNLNLTYGSPRPVSVQDTSDPQDLRGNLWEWSQDPFTPLDGFQPHTLYLNHAQPFFDDRHRVMLGGSWATTGTMAAKSYRNWFRPHFYQHVGFRLIRDI